MKAENTVRVLLCSRYGRVYLSCTLSVAAGGDVRLIRDDVILWDE